MSLEIGELRSLLSPVQISESSEDLLKYGRDWLKQWDSSPSLILFPKNSKDIVSIVRWARKHKYGLIPAGGRTGLSGGTVALKKEAIVSFDKMDQILDFNSSERTVCVAAGCITKNLQEFAKDRGLYFPISFAAEGSSQIGGNIATNVGGVHVLRYGSMRSHILALEVVTGAGEILNLGRGLVKNAVGYNLKELFIGSEGTLGFISKAELSLVSPPDKAQVFLMSVEKSDHLLSLLKEFRGPIQPLAFEFWTDKALEYVLSHGSVDFPLSERSPFYVLLELEEKETERAFAIFEKAFNKNLVKDGVLSQSLEQAQKIWSLRENISEAISSHQPYKNDICVRVSKITDFFKELEGLLGRYYPEFENVVFGHLGDGNLHINILKPKALEKKDFVKECEKVNDILFGLVQKYEGSISAEHGVGLLKKPYLQYSCSKEELAIMKGIKKLFDPDNILNPGKIFDF